MAIYYNISPQLNILIYVCTGVFTGATFFETGDKVNLDPRFTLGMKVIIDIDRAEIEASVSDLHLAVAKNKQIKESGKEMGQTAVYTQSTSLKFLGNALRMFSPEAPTNFGIYHDKLEAIRWLGYSETEQDVLIFWDSIGWKPG